jgi:3-oxoacyl-[acyl-carrier protein] reductase
MKIMNGVRKVIRNVLPPKKEIVPILTPVDKEQLLQGKVALITGGSSGIGYAIAQAFLNSGCKVIIAGSNKEKLERAVENLSGKVKGIQIDISNITSIPDKVKEAASLFEENRIDILVNSAGVHHTLAFENMTEEQFDKIMDTNVKGTFFMCQSVGKYMKDNKIKGHILNLSSSSALRPAWGPYQMSKWAIRGFTLGLAEKLQPYGIVVNAIAPGQTATPMLNKENTNDLFNGYALSGRYITPEEVANLAVFMVSDMGNMIVGDTFYMTGGSGTITFEH